LDEESYFFFFAGEESSTITHTLIAGTSLN